MYSMDRDLDSGRFIVGGMVGEKNVKWKGNAVGYDALHDWVKRKLGRPMQCSKCGKTGDNPHMFQWANINGKYRRDIRDWVRLCAKCHFDMDDRYKRTFGKWSEQKIRVKQVNNRSGFKNVRITKYGRFRAYITVNGKQEHIGNFSTGEEAYNAYKQRALELYGVC